MRKIMTALAALALMAGPALATKKGGGGDRPGPAASPSPSPSPASAPGTSAGGDYSGHGYDGSGLTFCSVWSDDAFCLANNVIPNIRDGRARR